MYTRYAVVHPQDGVFVGFSMGMAFFSLLDSAEQRVAVVSVEPDDFARVIRPHSPDVHVVRVECANDEYATPDELERAGIDPFMLIPLRYVPTHPAPRRKQ